MFNINEETKQIAMNRLGTIAKLLSGSKSFYRRQHPKDFIIFNSNIYMPNGDGYEKIWYGDINLTQSLEDLKLLAKDLKRTIYILWEMDGRFGNEDDPNIDKYALKVDPIGTYSIREENKQYYDEETLTLKEKYVRHD